MTCVVELCGLPGSGKTTLAGALRAALESRGVRCTVADLGISAQATKPRRVARRAGAAARESLRHPSGAVEAARLIARTGQPDARDEAAGLAQWLAVRDVLARAHTQPGIHLLEEGVVQTLWTLALRARHDTTAALWHGLPLRARADLVVHVDAPVDLAVTRLDQRASQHSRTQRLDPAVRAAELARGRSLLEEILATVPIPVLRVGVDHLASPALLGERVAVVLLRSVGHRPIGPHPVG